ncbi:DNA primase [Pannus brasiliensis CCIBt3594]|uniref:DNA primase n=1 Tax=Pannus brasiliensis CCIBt3594 TaxID=1427578 RepID=A0AAW9QF10_9CHRO
MDTPRLHPDTIEEVKQRVDIVDIVSERVVLKKRGRDFVGLCPFHDEKSPSFSVSPTKQMYYCFGCGAGGNAIKFLMEVGKQSFGDVVFDLARRYQIPLKTLAPEQRQELQRQLSLKEQLYEIVAVAVSFYQHALYQEEGKIALDYLLGKRKLSRETIESFQLGYSPSGWETLYRYLVEQKRYPLALVEQAGLIQPRKNGSGYFDRFRDRLMIPILDVQGRAIAFGSRTLGNDEPKYLNSPETPLFEKGKTLFALDKAKGTIAKDDRAIVVEGYFDAIALHAAGITSAVASLGTAFSQEQIKQILRYSESKQVIFNFDADKAGVKATARAIEEISSLVYSGQVQLRILNLPDGKDADEFLQSSLEAIDTYHRLIENAPFWIDWRIGQILLGQDLKRGDRFQQVAREMVGLLQKLEDSNQRTFYLEYCAEILAQKDGSRIPHIIKTLSRQMNKPIGLTARSNLPKLLERPETSASEKAEWILLLIYLHCSNCRERICELLDEKDLIFNVHAYRILWQQILELQPTLKHPDDLVSTLQNHLLSTSEKENREIRSLFTLNENTLETLFRPEEQIDRAIAWLEKISLLEYRRYCQERWRYYQIESPDPERSRFYETEFRQTAAKLRAIDPHYREREEKLS